MASARINSISRSPLSAELMLFRYARERPGWSCEQNSRRVKANERMKKRYDRREVLKGMSAACAAFLLPEEQVRAESVLRIGGQDVEIQIGSVSKHTFRLSILPIKDGRVATIPTDGSLVRESWGTPIAKMRNTGARTINAAGVNVRIAAESLTFLIETAGAAQIKKITVDE